MKDILQVIVMDPSKEARWLNTLSLLESMGASKISRSIGLSHPHSTVLKHYFEEARHAYAFKFLSERVMGGACTDYLCRQEGIDYFQKLDFQISKWITDKTGKEDTYQNYLLVTTMIEKRAISLYPMYLHMTVNLEVKEELKRIIFEESDHKPLIEESALQILKKNGVPDFKPLQDIEKDLFNNFEQALRRQLLWLH